MNYYQRQTTHPITVFRDQRIEVEIRELDAPKLMVWVRGADTGILYYEATVPLDELAHLREWQGMIRLPQPRELAELRVKLERALALVSEIEGNLNLYTHA